MRIVVAIDRSDPTFALVHAVARLYSPAELTLVHAVDHGLARYPAAGTTARKMVQAELQPIVDAGHKLLENAAQSIPSELNITPKHVCELGNPARVIIKAAETEAADLIVIGSGEHSDEQREFKEDSITHRIASHAPCSTLVLRLASEQVRRVLLAIKGLNDASEIRHWLSAHPFRNPVEMTVLHVVPEVDFILEGRSAAHHDQWHDFLRNESADSGQTLVDDVAAKLNNSPSGLHYKARGQVFNGDPAEVIAKEAAQHDLVIVGSHGGLSAIRFLYGSVAQKVLHRVSGPILITG